MTHAYNLTGMTCGNCEAKVKSNLLMVPDITSVEVSKDTNTATITMDKHIALSDLQKALGGAESKYQISAVDNNEVVEQTKSWFAIYKPILIIFLYIILLSSAVVFKFHLDIYSWMNLFMAQFFLVFSFFKMLDLKGFAESYAMYDMVAKKWNGWGYVYAFIELALGVAYLISLNPIYTNATAFIVMSISITGVLQAVLNKKKIRCACLGAIFNLPMSTITIIEDALMIVMSGIMLLKMF